ncbi:hypothetical protein BKA70DRAFT_1220043 [Coprinopsis sp. MPI-PUGE-AT-0042]|nr:hypothetical protein BKA70DRAFT_1220043 [Coprinopsis sp. MPI-PUGE-AT-0042]
MPSSRLRSPQKTLPIRARLYCADNTEAESVSVPTLESHDGRYPLVEAFLADEKIQPFIHDCLVTVSYCGRRHQFRVFYKNHKLLKRNRSLPHNSTWRGDILVVRGGVKTFGVNLRAKDTKLIDYVVKRFIVLKQSRLPSVLTL